MTLYVVDANVVAKWFVPERLSEEAVRLLDERHELASPDLLWPELGSVLWKKARAGQLTGREAARILRALDQFPVTVRRCQSDQVEPIHARVAKPHRPVEVRGGHAAGGADESDHLARVDDAPGLHLRFAEVAVEAEEPEAVVEDHRAPGEEEVRIQYDASTLHGTDGSPGRRAEVHPGVR